MRSQCASFPLAPSLARALHRDVDLLVECAKARFTGSGHWAGGIRRNVLLVVMRNQQLHVARILVVLGVPRAPSSPASTVGSIAGISTSCAYSL